MDHNHPERTDRWIGKGLWIKDLRMQDLSEGAEDVLAARMERDNMLRMNQRKGRPARTISYGGVETPALPHSKEVAARDVVFCWS
jgi:hypothetical protein